MMRLAVTVEIGILVSRSRLAIQRLRWLAFRVPPAVPHAVDPCHCRRMSRAEIGKYRVIRSLHVARGQVDLMHLDRRKECWFQVLPAFDRPACSDGHAGEPANAGRCQVSPVNRPGFCGGSHCREDESCGSTEEVQPGVA